MPYSPPSHVNPHTKADKAATTRHYNKHIRVNESFYNSSRWRKIAKLHKQQNPLCVDCRERGIVQAVQITDHIVAIDDGGELFNFDNLQSLCIPCHNTKTAEDNSNR